MMINICSMSVFWQVLSKNFKNEIKSTKVVKKQQHTETYIYIYKLYKVFFFGGGGGFQQLYTVNRVILYYKIPSSQFKRRLKDVSLGRNHGIEETWSQTYLPNANRWQNICMKGFMLCHECYIKFQMEFKC